MKVLTFSTSAATSLPDYANGSSDTRLHPWYVTGLADGEGSFGFSIEATNTGKYKYRFEFKVTQKATNAGILYGLQRYFGVGTVVIDNRSDNTLKYHVTSRDLLINTVLPHFQDYPLVTSKKLNLASFTEAMLVANKDIKVEGSVQDRMASIKSNMNKGQVFSDKFNSVSITTLAPEWVQAFTDGEGMFYSYVAIKTSRNTTYQRVDLSLEIGQASHDVAVLASLAAFFNGGYVSPKCDITSLEAVQSIRAKSIFKYRDIGSIIKFYDQYPLLTNKQLDFQSFKAIADIKFAGGHNTVEGLAKIKELKAGMNKGRNNNQPKVEQQ